MPTSPTVNVLDEVRQVLLARDGASFGDAELLGWFVERRDEAALAALVRRHGPMVWGVCRRLLSHHDAEDAFQAAFHVLVRKAASIVPRDRVANWLYGVAHRAALQARRTAMRRQKREVHVLTMPEKGDVPSEQVHDACWLLDEELSRLPEKYRTVIVLCDLEERTRKEVAQELRVPEGTVAGWLARARALLGKRLAARGVALSANALVLALVPKGIACMPASLPATTIGAAQMVAAGQTGMGLSPGVAPLTSGVMKGLAMSKLKGAAVALLAFTVVGAGGAIVSRVTAPSANRVALSEPPRAGAPEMAAMKSLGAPKDDIAWGQDIKGLQAGVNFARPKRAYSHGESIKFSLWLRNVGEQEVTFSYLHPFIERMQTVTDDTGRTVPQTDIFKEIGSRLPGEVTLAPGQAMELHQLTRELRSASESGENWFSNTPRLYATGKVHVHFEQVLGSPEMGTRNWKLDPALGRLATGTLDLEVQSPPILVVRPAPPATTEKK
jgi:RNA polymerase sigma factor (sigma-70 family)